MSRLGLSIEDKVVIPFGTMYTRSRICKAVTGPINQPHLVNIEYQGWDDQDHGTNDRLYFQDNVRVLMQGTGVITKQAGHA